MPNFKPKIIDVKIVIDKKSIRRKSVKHSTSNIKDFDTNKKFKMEDQEKKALRMNLLNNQKNHWK